MKTRLRGRDVSLWLVGCWLLLLAQTVSPVTSFNVWSPTSRTTRLFASENTVVYEKKKQQRDVVIVGGALAGLSAALYLSQLDPSRHITVLDRESYGNADAAPSKHAQPASFAAAGMLAPNSERLPPGKLLQFCKESRTMYPDFCDMVESLAQEPDGRHFLYPNQFDADSNNNDTLEPWSVGYVASGGFLAPAFAGDSVATWAPPDGSAIWLDRIQVRELEPSLHPEVVGGWWFTDDASVDARRLTCSLRAACVSAGVQILAGPQHEVTSLDLIDTTCKGLWTANHKYISANTVLVANGAWMRELLPVPIESHKGQSLSLRMPTDRPNFLKRVLFAQDSYIVPKADGRIVVGATVEAGSFDPNVTPVGLMHILTHAMQLVPGLKDLPVEETWVGLRPTTPDKGPVLGKTPWDNLLIAGGYWRNGVLMAPKTGHLLAKLIVAESRNESLEESDAAYLKEFAWDRFTTDSTKFAANARYASSMHPVHRRGGTSTSVGIELGSYSTARAAKDERSLERKALLESDFDSFEKAAALGKMDSSAYSFGLPEPSSSSIEKVSLVKTPEEHVPTLPVFEGTPDALTVGASQDDEDDSALDEEELSLEDAYKAIQENKAKQTAQLGNDGDKDPNHDKPDPGFRIYHVDQATRQARVIPPFTSPGEFLNKIDEYPVAEIPEHETSQSPSDDLNATYESMERNKAASGLTLDAKTNGDNGFLASIQNQETKETVDHFIDSIQKEEAELGVNGSSKPEVYDERTYDGYTVIVDRNARSSRDEELQLMKEARRKNRITESVDTSKIGVIDLGDEQEE